MGKHIIDADEVGTFASLLQYTEEWTGSSFFLRSHLFLQMRRGHNRA